MVLSKADPDIPVNDTHLTSSQKRRIRRKRLQAALTRPLWVVNEIDKENIKAQSLKTDNPELPNIVPSEILSIPVSKIDYAPVKSIETENNKTIMEKSRESVLAAREAKKLAKLKGKGKDVKDKVDTTKEVTKDTGAKEVSKLEAKEVLKLEAKPNDATSTKVPQAKTESPKGKDEVDKAVLKSTDSQVSDKNKDQIKAERVAKKAAKQAKKKGEEIGDAANSEMTVKDVVETLKDIANVAKEIDKVTDKVQAIKLEANKEKPQATEESGKSKAELRAERRAKQEAQRAAKQAAEVKTKPKEAKEVPVKSAKVDDATVKRETTPTKAKSVERTKPKPAVRVNWFQHLSTEHDKESLKKVPLNSNLHPAIIKLGVQLASKVVTGSNARCIALLDALRKMVADYTLPARTEYGRGLESQLTASLEYLWSLRPPCAAQTNAVKHFRHQLTQLPNTIDEYDAKKKLQDLIDNYIHDQIDTAGEAISLAVRNKILPGDTILTFGCSSLIERILTEAWADKPHFNTVVVGHRAHDTGREMLRRLSARGLPTTYTDITAISFLMKNINKVLLGASSLLVNGSVLGAVGSAQVALVARAHNVPVLVACETHKFSERVQTDAFVYNELGDPDDLIDKTDDNSPLKDWRSNPNLTPLNIIYDVTPPNLVTAVVTELAILPCTSAPVVLRTKLAEHGV